MQAHQQEQQHSCRPLRGAHQQHMWNCYRAQRQKHHQQQQQAVGLACRACRGSSAQRNASLMEAFQHRAEGYDRCAGPSQHRHWRTHANCVQCKGPQSGRFACRSACSPPLCRQLCLCCRMPPNAATIMPAAVTPAAAAAGVWCGRRSCQEHSGGSETRPVPVPTCFSPGRHSSTTGSSNAGGGDIQSTPAVSLRLRLQELWM
jgi:hypothetical protein